MNPDVSYLAKAADCIDLALEHLAKAERRGVAPASSVASFARFQMLVISKRLCDCADEISNRPDEREAAA